MNIKIVLVMLFLTVLAVEQTWAVEPDEILSDPALEARAREISRTLRCVVCQSENIDDSNAPLARDLRLLVRDRLTAGDSDQAVVDFVVARYGDYVLLKPPVQKNTLLLWGAPLILALIAGVGCFVFFLRREKTMPPKPLSASEQDQIEEMLG